MSRVHPMARVMRRSLRPWLRARDGTDHGPTQSTVRDVMPRQLILFYYPGGATDAQGPTAAVRGSQYVSIDREQPDGEHPRMSSSEDRLGSPAQIARLGNDDFFREERLVCAPGTVVIVHHVGSSSPFPAFSAVV